MQSFQVNPGFGTRLALVRRDLGLSKLALARAALSNGASSKNIGRIEAEEVTPRVGTLGRVAEFGGVNLEWLATGECVLKPGTVCRTGGVGARIKEARLARGLTRNALSREAGLGNTTKNVDRLEVREHAPRAATLVKLANVLKVSPTYLAYGK